MQNTPIQDALEVINYQLVQRGLTPLTETDIKDWGITGDETNDQLEQYAHDFISEEHTARCEAKNAWRYEL